MSPVRNEMCTSQTRPWTDWVGVGPKREGDGGGGHRIVLPVFENPLNIGTDSGLFGLITGTHGIPFVFKVTMMVSMTRKLSQWRTDSQSVVSGNVVEVHLIVTRVLPL